MFIRLTPYLTWLGIMLTSNPSDLDTKITILSQPPTTTTRPPTTTTRTDIDVFLCAGKPNGRYPHLTSCTKYYMCSSDKEIVKPSVCPKGLHFSPTAFVCTIREEAGCTVTPAPMGSTSTTRAPDSTWIIEASKLHKALDDDSLVVYYDRDIQNPSSLTWPVSFARSLWDNVLNMYGPFGTANRLHLLLRGRPQSDELSYSTYLESDRQFINSIEVGSANWSVEDAANKDAIALNMAYIVTKSARGARYTFPEQFWPEIFVYDLYTRSTRTTDASRWAEKVRVQMEGIASVSLFSHWYREIYQMEGGRSLNRFLIDRFQNFPKAQGNSTFFARPMNTGEFIHFWSYAVRTNLTNMATNVFAWNDQLRERYRNATIDFNLIY